MSMIANVPSYHRFYLIIFIVELWFVCVHSKSYPETISIGAMAPQFKSDGTADHVGKQCVASLIMSINEINNKFDGKYDNLLPSTQIKLAYRSPRRNFIMATSMAIQLSTAFNGAGVLGVIGPIADDACKATAQIFSYTDYKVPQISYGASSADLADKTLYPFFMRTISSVAYEGVVIANLIKNKFRWSTVNTICAADTYGNDICEAFKSEAALLGITIESSNTFWSGAKDVSDILAKIKSNGGILKIFVLLMTASDAAVFLEQGTNSGLFKEGVQIIGTQYMLTSTTWSTLSSTKVASIMKGIISVSPTTIPNPDLYPDFIHRWRSQNNTVGHHNSDGSYSCDTTKDDDDSFYLYQGHANAKNYSSPYTCVGLNFSSFAADGSDISTLALNVYDSVVVLAKGLHKLYYEDGVTSFTGDTLNNVLLNISFTGLTGNIGFDHTSLDQTTYGQGDRKQGLTYNVFNFNPTYLSINSTDGSVIITSQAIRKIGSWYSDSHSFSSCDKTTDILCSDIVYNTADNSIPRDEAPIIEIQMPYLTRVLLRVAGSMVLASTLFFVLLVLSYRNHRIVKASQPAMMMAVLLGALLACVRVFIATIDITDTTCIAGKWLGHMSFGLFFGAVILKTWRVNMVVNSGMKRVRITVGALQQILAVGLLLLVCYLFVDTLVGQPHRSYEASFDGHNIVRKIKCYSKIPQITTGLFILEGILLFYGAKLCWSTKNAPDAVNDSQYIAMALYLIVFVCALTFPIVFLRIQPTPAMLLTIMASGFIIGTFGSTIVLFAPKAYLLLTGADVNENFEIVRDSQSNKKSSNTPIAEVKSSSIPLSRLFLNVSSVLGSRVHSDHPYHPSPSHCRESGGGALPALDVDNNVETLLFSADHPIMMKRASSVPKLRQSQLSIDFPLKESKREGEVKSSEMITSHCLLNH